MALNIWYLSDLHLNYNRRRIENATAMSMALRVLSDRRVSLGSIQKRTGRRPDVIVLAGDICEGVAGIEWAGLLRRKFRIPVIYVPGNHEPYGEILPLLRVEMAQAAQTHDVMLLDDRTRVIQGVRFVGSTLWTNFEICGGGDRAWAMRDAATCMNDFRLIEVIEEDGRERVLTPSDTVALHEKSVAFLDAALADALLPTVVVTHHLPHPNSIAPRYRASRLNAAFCSNLEPLILRHQPLLWIHGHTHDSMDYCIGNTRIVCNPLGYGDENPWFDPFKVATIEV